MEAVPACPVPPRQELLTLLNMLDDAEMDRRLLRLVRWVWEQKALTRPAPPVGSRVRCSTSMVATAYALLPMLCAALGG